MIIRLLDNFINISLVREVLFDGEHTKLVFDQEHSVSLPGDFREHLRLGTGGWNAVASNAADFTT